MRFNHATELRDHFTEEEARQALADTFDESRRRIEHPDDEPEEPASKPRPKASKAWRPPAA